MSTLWLHMRNSPIRWTLPFLVVLALAVLFFRSQHWIGVWPETGAAAQTGVLLLGAATAGAAAWAAGAPSRHQLGEQLGAAHIHPTIAEAHRLGATVIILLMPYLVGHAVAFAITAWTFPPGWHLWWGYFLLGLVAILLATAWGWLLGKFLGSVFAALTALVSWLVLALMVVDYLDIQLTALRGPPELIVDPAAVGWRLALATAWLATLPWLASLGSRRPPAWRLLVPATAAVGVAVALSTTSVVVERDPIGHDAQCVEGRATDLCIWPEHEKYLPLLQDLNRRIDALPATLVIPPRMNEVGIERTWYLADDGVIRQVEGDFPPEFMIIEGSPWAYAGSIQSAILAATWDGCDWQPLADLDQHRHWVLNAWLETYLVGGGAPDYHTSAPPQMQDAWAQGQAMANEATPAEQFDWAEREIDELRERYCQPSH